MNNCNNIKRKVAIIDSGLGGFHIYQQLQTHYPLAQFTFVADQLHMPYGLKTKTQLLSYVLPIIEALAQQEVNEVIVACNTLCSTIFTELVSYFPKLHFVNIVDQIIADLKKDGRNALVLATETTINSHYLAKRLAPYLADLTMLAMPNLASEIEERKVNQNELAQLALFQYDQIILACTHYPIISDLFKQLGAKYIVSGNISLINRYRNVSFYQGESKLYTTGDVVQFKQKIQQISSQPRRVEAWQNIIQS